MNAAIIRRSRPASQPVSVQASTAADLHISEPEDTGIVHKVAFYSGLGWLLVLSGMIHELLLYVLHVNTYLLYVFAPVALLGAMLTGAIPRIFSASASRYWLVFVACMTLSIPLSTWPGNSFQRLFEYGRYSLPLLVIPAGVALNWREVKVICNTIACGGLIVLLSARQFAEADNGRISLGSSGSIGNSNDLAAHIVWVIPFIFLMAMDKKRLLLIRLLLLASSGYGLMVVLGTASRGAMLAIAACFLFAITHANARQKMVAGIAVLVLVISAPLLLPQTTKTRLISLFTNEDAEAAESRDARSELFRKSLTYTMQHPVLGVGLDQFSTYEGLSSAASGVRGQWHATHCAFTQVSSENGVPALVFFTMGIGAAFLSVRKTWKRARLNGFTDIANTCFCYMMSVIALIVAFTFLANAYRFYLPVVIGLGIAISMTAARRMESSVRPEGSQPHLHPLLHPYFARQNARGQHSAAAR
ncbi:MAG: O-antigen polymerase [Bryobacterales bacterium]|nr:O-antigen polymerase [Bryobacterales bacterium]